MEPLRLWHESACCRSCTLPPLARCGQWQEIQNGIMSTRGDHLHINTRSTWFEAVLRLRAVTYWSSHGGLLTERAVANTATEISCYRGRMRRGSPKLCMQHLERGPKLFSSAQRRASSWGCSADKDVNYVNRRGTTTCIRHGRSAGTRFSQRLK